MYGGGLVVKFKSQHVNSQMGVTRCCMTVGGECKRTIEVAKLGKIEGIQTKYGGEPKVATWLGLK